MKYIKMFAVTLCMFAVVSCSDSKDINTEGDVTVEMGQNEVTVKEHSGLFNVPIKITGERNGNVKVRVKVEGTGNNPAAPFEENNGEWTGNYIVTSKDINVPADVNTVNVEITAVDDKVINEDRTFLVSIESAEGANVGVLASTLVVLKDNDSVPYERIQGDWTFTYYDFDNVQKSMNVTLTGFDESSKRYGVELELNGMYIDYAADKSTKAQVYFYEDEGSDMSYVEILIPQIIGSYVQDSAMSMWLIYAGRDGNGGVSMNLNNTVLTGIISEDFETITFDEGIGFAWYFATASFDDQLGALDAATDIIMTKH